MFAFPGAIVFYAGIFIYFIGVSVHLMLMFTHGEETPFWKNILVSILWPGYYAYAFAKEIFRILFG